MKRDVISFYGEKQEVVCLGCAINEGTSMEGILPVYVDDYFHVHQDYEIPIPGFIIMATKRHIDSIEEFTDEERDRFIKVAILARKAMHEVLHIDNVTLVQEETTSDHFHMWFFPHYPWMKEKFGTRIQHLRLIMEYARTEMKTRESFKKVEDSIVGLRKFMDRLKI